MIVIVSRLFRVPKAIAHCNMNDLDARALFEKTVAKITDPEKSKPLWLRWAKYEYATGDLLAIQKLDQRLKAIYPDGALDLHLQSINSTGSSCYPHRTFDESIHRALQVSRIGRLPS
jgi:hypothetical protein